MIFSNPMNAPPQTNKIPPLRRHVANRPFQDLQQRLLHAFARDVPRDGHVFRLARDLVNLINIDNPHLRALDIVVGILEQAQNDVLHVLPHVAGFGQGRGVGDGERHVQDFGQGAGEQRLARTGGADQQNVGFLDLDIGVAGAAQFAAASSSLAGRLLHNPLEMIMHRHGQGFLGVVLAHAMAVQVRFDVLGFGGTEFGRRPARLRRKLLVQHAFAQEDAIVANIDPGALNHFFRFRGGFPAETAEREVIGSCHRVL
jgi:hypothetical protein